MRGSGAAGLLVLGALAIAGCRLHLDYVIRNRSHALGSFEEIALGDDRPRQVLAALGPPDEVEYHIGAIVFDYLSGTHRGSEFEVFLPSEVIPGIDPLALLSVPRIFFDPSGTPDVMRPSTFERIGRGGARLLGSLVPFASGEEIVTLKGHRLRHDRLRVVFDRETRVAVGKSLRLASGSYREESLAASVFLQAD